MSHQTNAFFSDKELLQSVLHRRVEKSGRFGPESTAEEVAVGLASEINGKTVIITGVSPSGLGAEAARVIFKQKPRLLILASRNKKTIDDTTVAIGGADSPDIVKAVELDLSDLESVRKAATEILDTTPVVDVLINNAGIMMPPSFKTTKQGIELQFGVNHVGHFLFTNLLMPALLRAWEGPCVVNISSAGHRAGGIRFDDLNMEDGKAYEPFIAYGQSKSANILFSVSLTEKLRGKGLGSFAVDPGAVATTGLSETIPFDRRVEMGWWNADGTPSEKLPWTSVGQGAAGYIVAGFDRDIAEQSGSCLAKGNIDPTTEAHATDPVIAEKLWLLSEELVGQKFHYAQELLGWTYGASVPS
ncbi:hypothetical protein BCR34DRAFT_598971 [Clohesyomyces aquaticus]|uniref:Short-chain dehydrogenase n=1 Tax=Clohesyomyces aquaticus TaxID=1231657 RepID=A0A1Y1ZX22_9PLEO|nr:hypothetical protein BCR34DRAFT_598971 [Clohesyomyces aquaticus]